MSNSESKYSVKSTYARQGASLKLAPLFSLERGAHVTNGISRGFPFGNYIKKLYNTAYLACSVIFLW